MLDRVERVVRHLRLRVSRSHRVAGAPVGRTAPSALPGLAIVQIDGLSSARLRCALADGTMPFTARLVAAEELRLVPVYSGLPSTTPAVQGELFYGIPGAVPAFAYVERATGILRRMYQRDATSAVEARLARASDGSLLVGGASYANVYTGGAADARFCMASLRVGDLFPRHRRWRIPLLALAHLPRLASLAGRAVREAAVALADRRRHPGEPADVEAKFVAARIVVGVVLEELTVLGMAIDLARGRPVVHGNFLGYDEHAHRRGPDAPSARRALRAVDRHVERLWRHTHHAHGRAYDLWVMSDHGQEATEPYVTRHGRTVADAVRTVVQSHGLLDPSSTEAGEEVTIRRAPALGERIVGRIVPGLDTRSIVHRPGRLTVVAQGPVGHVYLPAPVTESVRDALAHAVVHDADVPLVLHPGTAGTAIAHTATGRHILPADAAEILGADHPYRDVAAIDLVALCHHPDAGDLVLSGWRRDGLPVSFPAEHGSHAGPGPQETDAFVLVPPDTPIVPGPEGIVRPATLRQSGFAVLRNTRGLGMHEPARRHGIRILTYNVHGCVGLDRRCAPERIARVIARQRPDIVVLQELDVGRRRSGHLDQARAIADALAMELAFHPTIAVADEQFGDAVLSPHPMRLVRAGALPGLGRARLEPRGALWVRVEIPEPGGTVRTVEVIGTHLSLHPTERAMAAEALCGPDWLGHPDAARDVVLCGDFNALAWFPTMRRLRRHLRDAQVGLDGHRPRRTWSGRFPLGRIDHVLVDPRWEVLAVDVPDHALARIASDHRPVVVDVVIPAGHPDPATYSARP